MRKKRNHFLIFMICVLAVPTCGILVGDFAPDMSEDLTVLAEIFRPWLTVGVLLGAVHLVLRPILRLFSAPVGCLTLGLSGWVIDIALIYVCAALVDGFRISGLLYAVLTALLINCITAVAGYDRK